MLREVKQLPKLTRADVGVERSLIRRGTFNTEYEHRIQRCGAEGRRYGPDSTILFAGILLTATMQLAGNFCYSFAKVGTIVEGGSSV